MFSTAVTEMCLVTEFPVDPFGRRNVLSHGRIDFSRAGGSREIIGVSDGLPIFDVKFVVGQVPREITKHGRRRPN